MGVPTSGMAATLAAMNPNSDVYKMFAMSSATEKKEAPDVSTDVGKMMALGSASANNSVSVETLLTSIGAVPQAAQSVATAAGSVASAGYAGYRPSSQAKYINGGQR